jgi:hypothetical protein
VNFVAQGTIEHGMLSVIQFKKSLFAGVLDGGEKDVFLGGSRLNKFMETVEKTTTAIPEPMLEDAEEALRAPMDTERQLEGRAGGRKPARAGRVQSPVPAEPEEEPVATGHEIAPTADPWSGLLQAGMALLQQVSSAARGGSTPGSAAAAAGIPSLIKRDERTGETYVKLPVPSAHMLDQALKAVSTLLESFRK